MPEKENKELERKLMMRAVLTILNDMRAKADPRLAQVPSEAALQEARTRLSKIDGVELLGLLRSGPGIFTTMLFD